MYGLRPNQKPKTALEVNLIGSSSFNCISKVWKVHYEGPDSESGPAGGNINLLPEKNIGPMYHLIWRHKAQSNLTTSIKFAAAVALILL